VVSLNSTGIGGGGGDCGGHPGVAAGDAGRGRRTVCVGLLSGVCGRRTPNRARQRQVLGSPHLADSTRTSREVKDGPKQPSVPRSPASFVSHTHLLT
jgi:hypothetical protein